MTDSSIPEEKVVRTIKSCLMAALKEGGLFENKLDEAFKEHRGVSIPYKSFGYASLNAFLSTHRMHFQRNGMKWSICINEELSGIAADIMTTKAKTRSNRGGSNGRFGGGGGYGSSFYQQRQVPMGGRGRGAGGAASYRGSGFSGSAMRGRGASNNYGGGFSGNSGFASGSGNQFSGSNYSSSGTYAGDREFMNPNRKNSTGWNSGNNSSDNYNNRSYNNDAPSSFGDGFGSSNKSYSYKGENDDYDRIEGGSAQYGYSSDRGSYNNTPYDDYQGGYRGQQNEGSGSFAQGPGSQGETFEPPGLTKGAGFRPPSATYASSEKAVRAPPGLENVPPPGLAKPESSTFSPSSDVKATLKNKFGVTINANKEQEPVATNERLAPNSKDPIRVSVSNDLVPCALFILQSVWPKALTEEELMRNMCTAHPSLTSVFQSNWAAVMEKVITKCNKEKEMVHIAFNDDDDDFGQQQRLLTLKPGQPEGIDNLERDRLIISMVCHLVKEHGKLSLADLAARIGIVGAMNLKPVAFLWHTLHDKLDPYLELSGSLLPKKDVLLKPGAIIPPLDIRIVSKLNDIQLSRGPTPNPSGSTMSEKPDKAPSVVEEARRRMMELREKRAAATPASLSDHETPANEEEDTRYSPYAQEQYDQRSETNRSDSPGQSFPIQLRDLSRVCRLEDVPWYHVRITSFDDLMNFHVRFEENEQAYTEMMVELQNFYRNEPRNTSPCRRGNSVAVYVAEDNYWYRGTIINANRKKMEVELVDVGQIVKTSPSNVLPLHTYFLQHKAFAFRCTVGHFEVDPDQERSFNEYEEEFYASVLERSKKFNKFGVQLQPLAVFSGEEVEVNLVFDGIRIPDYFEKRCNIKFPYAT